MEIKQGDKVKVSKDAPKVYLSSVNNLVKYHVCKVEEVDGDSAIIRYTDIGIDCWLAIPTKYLVKVDAEAKEAKYKKGDRVKFKNIYELQKVKDKSFRWMLVMFASKEATITAVEDNGFYRVDIDPSIGGINDDMIECKVEPTEHTEAEKSFEDQLRDVFNGVEHQDYGRPIQTAMINLDINDWDSYAADLAKEVALKVANKYNDPEQAAEYAVKVAKSVVEGLKRE